MGQKTITGLTLKDGVWHIDKVVHGVGRIRGSTGTSARAEAEQFLLARIAEAQAAKPRNAAAAASSVRPQPAI